MAHPAETAGLSTDPWRSFTGGRWQDHVDVHDFIQANVTPYTGDAAFLADPTERTRRLWERMTEMFPQEQARGIYDVDARTPSSITAHAPGYIDREHELIVGLQTDAPLRRAIMPNGGLRMVENGLAAYGYTLDPAVRDIFTKYRKTHNDGVFDAYPSTAEIIRDREELAERDLRAERLSETDAQELIDDFVIKLRIVRSCARQNTISCSQATRPG